MTACGALKDFFFIRHSWIPPISPESLPSTYYIGNDASDAGVTWSVPSGVGSIVIVSGAPHYKAPFVNPENRVVDVLATSIADPSKTSVTKVTVYAIVVQAYAAGSVSGATLGSGGSLALTFYLGNDAANAGVTWSVVSGGGSISGTTFTGPVVACHLRNANANVVVSTIQATSVSDPSKFSRTTVTTYSSQCP